MLAYPGIELVDFKGSLQDIDDKHTVTIDHFRAQHDQKQAVLSQASTDTSVGFWTVVPSDTRRIYLLALQSSVYLIEAGERNGSRFSAFWLL